MNSSYALPVCTHMHTYLHTQHIQRAQQTSNKYSLTSSVPSFPTHKLWGCLHPLDSLEKDADLAPKKTKNKKPLQQPVPIPTISHYPRTLGLRGVGRALAPPPAPGCNPDVSSPWKKHGRAPVTSGEGKSGGGNGENEEGRQGPGLGGPG